MTYGIRYSNAAAKSLRKLQKKEQVSIVRTIERLQNDPRPAGVKKIMGGAGELRIRVGNFRIIYEIQDGVLLILVLAIGHRCEVYRDF
ncbi:type II toxin-antitoxin system RelE family toxin [Corynebacterium epidermidicanis]|uniref:Cytotoxic translational repressor of toxin-antitoxin stability system n=1 Tax=Corynebacterium epidermidicanis TaxID=1050174 RepID=A0A0G3GUD2_9CORY|nr:type II toxin-antitoxin system RelE/ParE family toxin [Corynebacterium epidermidicanis]AKK02492.1 cytotoxic translational repressor of toxin-antitoxin stability system [Corynebacterium epidermidicanis]